ncbi:galactokinase [Strigomonas culicis]|uniref:Galactokinase n=1 Tax=Strigomonas culicis TaxID=28005 RepID=S9UH04_9TRYP|nr:galactokinase [Strigomonas culicis]|eukprot:EPY28208.1 galactokinase [Strigomonas culicis]
MPAEGFPDSRIDQMLGELQPLFIKQFGVKKPADVEWLLYSFAPGRINLIGEHVDYMGGFVCPAAVPDGTHIVAGRLRSAEEPPPGLRFFVTYAQEHFDVPSLPVLSERGLKTWQKYIVGAITLRLAYLGLSLDAPELRGVCFVIHGTVPVGAGLSASASFGVALLCALNSVLTEDYRRARTTRLRTHRLVPLISLKERLLIAQQARQIEAEFCGTEVGMMGHFNAALAEANKFMVIDCTKWTYQTCGMDTISGHGYGWLLVDSMIRHDLMGDTQTVFNEVRRDQEMAQKRIAANLFKGSPFTFRSWCAHRSSTPRTATW